MTSTTIARAARYAASTTLAHAATWEHRMNFFASRKDRKLSTLSDRYFFPAIFKKQYDYSVALFAFG